MASASTQRRCRAANRARLTRQLVTKTNSIVRFVRKKRLRKSQRGVGTISASRCPNEAGAAQMSSAAKVADNTKMPPSFDAISGAQKAIKYIELLERVDIWGYEDVPMQELLRPMTLSVIDVAGVDQWISEFIVAKVLNEAWGIAVNEGLAASGLFRFGRSAQFCTGQPRRCNRIRRWHHQTHRLGRTQVWFVYGAHHATSVQSARAIRFRSATRKSLCG
jgi:hypothetical protein